LSLLAKPQLKTKYFDFMFLIFLLELDSNLSQILLVISDCINSVYMRVITWNCNMAFRKKYKQILPYDPDLLIVSECEHPEKLNTKFYNNVLWVGNNRNKGLAVFSFNDFEIAIHESYCENYKYVLPVIVTNNKAMNLVAVWSQNNKEDPRRRYIGEVWQSLNYYKNMFNSPTIIAGDFNWNVIWDKEHSNYPLHGTFTDVSLCHFS
jgi:exodeoxyribonuclease III